MKIKCLNYYVQIIIVGTNNNMNVYCLCCKGKQNKRYFLMNYIFNENQYY